MSERQDIILENCKFWFDPPLRPGETVWERIEKVMLQMRMTRTPTDLSTDAGLEGMQWRPIESAPTDGRQVWVKRIFEGRIIKEGWAVFGSLAANAPMRQWSDGGLGDPIPPDNEAADARRWCNPDRLHRFPTPTHWSPARTALGTVGGE
jgi:hypothetical protein